MTDDEVIKALECCLLVGKDCDDCPYFSKESCNDSLYNETINLINRQQAEKKLEESK